MTQVIEATKGKIRDLPIQARLRDILIAAGRDAGIDIVRVTSGGQARLGSGGKRTGSTRHDDGAAADLQLEKGGRVLSFQNAQERPIVAQFVTAAAFRGATGIGAGVSYMGPHTLHVGFGSRLVWGAGGRSANAPAWLREAVAAAVRELQTKLGITADGVFGPATKAAVKAFQTKHGLLADGVVGPATLGKLL